LLEEALARHHCDFLIQLGFAEDRIDGCRDLLFGHAFAGA
jgi:hypothetical protein